MFSVDVDSHEAYAYAQEKTKMQFLIEEAANILRSEVMALKDSYASLPYPLHASDIAKGEATVLVIVTDFFKVLYTGS